VNVQYKNYNGKEYLYLEDYWESGLRYVESLTLFDATQTDAWGMERVYFTAPDPTVPEPATATLGLMALAALALRRRRA
jgi:MYXO-CTERM domain-containing protein